MAKRTPTLNLIQIQDRYVQRVNEAAQRWGHRTVRWGNGIGGHYSRIQRAAYREALTDLLAWGLSEQQARSAIQQAADMAELERNAKE